MNIRSHLKIEFRTLFIYLYCNIDVSFMSVEITFKFSAMHATLYHLLRYVNLRLASTPPPDPPNGPGPPMKKTTTRNVTEKLMTFHLVENRHVVIRMIIFVLFLEEKALKYFNLYETY